MMKRVAVHVLKTAMMLATAIVVSACGGGGGGGGDTPTTPTTPAPPAVASVSITLGATQLVAGGATSAAVELRSASGAVLTGRAVAWASTVSTVATIDGAGNISAVGAGTTTISATSEGTSASVVLTVLPSPVATVSVTLAQSSVVVGAQVTATASLRDDRGTALTNRAVTWTSSTTSVATVNGDGVIITLAPGTTLITATSEGKSGVASLIVLPPPVATITVSLSQSTVIVGGAASASAVLRDGQGNALSGRAVTWTSSAPNIAQIDASGVITTLAPGATTITASSEGKSGIASLLVQLPPVASVTIAGPTTVVPGQQVSLTATLRDGGGAVLTNRAVTWGSSDNTLALVSSSGNVTGLAPGSVTVSATSEGKTGTLQMAVRFAIASVTVTGSSRTKVGDTYTYTATARLADGSIINRPMTWSVKETSMATMTVYGMLTPLQAGSFTIQVTIDGEVWDRVYSAYDWESFTSSGTQFATLKADNLITNKYGTSEYPELIVSCGTSGYFFVWIHTDNFVTQSGLVALSFDGGAPFSQTWSELSPSYSTLWKPGSNGTVKAFALQIAAAQQFGFAFTEYLGSAKAMIFRVGGLLPRLTPLFNSCPSNALVTSAEQTMALTAGLRAGTAASAAIRIDRESRASATPGPLVVPSMQGLNALRAPEALAARRRP